MFGHLNYVCPEKNESSSLSDDRDIKLNEVIHYVLSGYWVEARSVQWESCRKAQLRCRNWVRPNVWVLTFGPPCSKILLQARGLWLEQGKNYVQFSQHL